MKDWVLIEFEFEKSNFAIEDILLIGFKNESNSAMKNINI